MIRSALTILAVVIALGAFFDVWRTIRANRRRHPGDEDAWERAAGGSDIPGQSILLSLARPFASLPSVYDDRSSIYRSVQRKLLAAGGMFGGSAEVFLALQTFFFIVATILVLLGIAGNVPPLLAFPSAVLLSTVLYVRLDGNARRRGSEVSRRLPEYAELLQIPIGAGMSVMGSLAFLSGGDSGERRVEGVVSDEVATMLSTIRAHALSEEEAFVLAGERLGTPEAKTFFNALLQAHVRGSKLSDNIAKQAAGLRAAEFQRQRSEAKKMPVKLVVMFSAFFLPFLFAIVLVPVMTTLGDLA